MAAECNLSKLEGVLLGIDGCRSLASVFFLWEVIDEKLVQKVSDFYLFLICVFFCWIISNGFISKSNYLLNFGHRAKQSDFLFHYQ